MTALPDAVTQLLWPQGSSASVYALLDTAGGSGVGSLLESLPSDIKASLYSGLLDEVFGAIAPSIVALAQNASFLKELVDEAWEDNAVVFARSTVKLSDAAAHFRGLVQADVEDEGPAFFRFYDPRVLRLYLPVAGSGDLKTVFGPVESFVMQGEDPDTAVEYRLSGGQLAAKSVSTADTAETDQ